METQIMKETTETREQIMEVIQFYLPTLTDKELRMLRGVIKGINKGKKKE